MKPQHTINPISYSRLAIVSIVLLCITQLAQAVTGTSTDFDSLPIQNTSGAQNSEPMAMLVMTNDHQLFYKAYNDWSNLDSDPEIEHTYDHSIDYYGYFDPKKCYKYDSSATGGARFIPKGIQADKLCTGTNSSYWSGNFLNWATMSRIDIVRKVLYGGYRSTDETNLTVLERAFIPQDAHSWVKHYDQADTSLDPSAPSVSDLTPYSGSVTEISMCNTTAHSGTSESQDVTDPPLLRVAKGDFRSWAANERWQCTWDGDKAAPVNDPDKATYGLTTQGGPDYIVRVETCVADDGSGTDLTGTEKCRKYPNNSSHHKPIGLLHEYGENDLIKFGLLTGSYKYNKSGGAVRKNVGTFSDEVNTTTDGSFDTSVSDGIVKTIDKLRVYGYDWDDGKYFDSSGNGGDNCPWAESEFAEGDCSNWGNPATEMYLEAVRYFAGLSRTSAFSDSSGNGNDDTGYISGLTNVGNWTDPFDSTNFCAACSIIMLNTSDFSYDADSLDMSGLLGGPSLNSYTNNVGTEEGLTSGDWFVGENGSDNNQLCTAKSITNLSDVRGTCPNSPRLGGSFHMPGIAHYARTNDIRSLTGDQTVQTFGVALSPSTPSLDIPVPGSPGQTVKIVPACRDDSATDLSGTIQPGNCAIVDFQITQPHSESGGVGTGQVTINWEDTEQGGDYDQDMLGTLSYTITSSNITIDSDVTLLSTPFKLGFGYVISGTTNDGVYFPTGSNSFEDISDATSDCTSSSPCDDDPPTSGTAADNDAAVSKTFTIGTTSADFPKDPLWYAAKWGGFNDYNDNGIPDLDYEWDQRNNDTGASGGDGVPDNYFLATNPATLESQLRRVFSRLLQRLSSGSAAAVIADTVTMTGGVVQALYQPEQTIDDKTLTWTGLVHSVFIDDNGNLREDTNGNARLDDYSTDKWIQILYDESAERTRVFYCNQSDDCASYDDIREIEDLIPIWNARDRLAQIGNAQITQQRAYTTSFGNSSGGGRHILTWLDNNSDGDVDSGEVVDFEDDTFTSANYGYLNAVDEVEAKNIVNFIRGEEGISGYRNRTADYDGSGEKAWRLGDIVHSTPLIVSRPNDGWDTRYGDNTYRNFRAQYEDRRSVVYVGSNDGMLHAFNAGFFDPNNSRFCLEPDCTGASEEDAHPLGAELWGYVPKNLLPHLRWLTEPDYPHVYYMDGKPQAFDVNIFPDDDDHPDGWGTILVVGMRLGGGELDVDYNNDSTVDYTAQSAYVILDITNPETPPEVLGEFTDTDLGFTTSAPQVAVRREADDTGDWTAAGGGTFPNDWYLVFGNGPTDLDTVTSGNNARLFALKLELLSGRLNVDSTQVTKIDTGVTNSFIGDPGVADWSNDFLSDAIYFGTIGGTAANPDGQLMRIALTSNSVSDWANSANRGTLIDPGQPFVHRPELVSIDSSPENKWWVYASTGRLYVGPDNSSTETQSMYGIREFHDSSAPHMLPDVDLTASRDPINSYPVQDVTGVSVYTDGTVDGNGVVSDPNSDGTFTFNELENVIDGKQGWYFDFYSDGTNPASRGISRATFWQNLVLFNSYNPPTDTSCLAEGFSDIWAIYYTTGTAHWKDIGFNITDNTSTNGAGFAEKVPKVELGYGIASDITLYRTKDGSKPIVQLTTGEIVDTEKVLSGVGESGRQSWRELPLE